MGTPLKIARGHRFQAWLTRRLTRRPATVLGATALLLTIAAGVAVASIPASGTGVFTGCYNTSTGALRLIDPSKGQTCKSGERQVTWDSTGITWKGTWNRSSAYTVRDAVAYQGSSYLATRASTGAAPSQAPADWAVLAQAGAAGPVGPRGPAGSAPLPDLSRVAKLDWWGGSYGGGSYGFDSPEGIAFDGTHLWVTNANGNSVTEFNASNGSWVQTLSGGSYGFNHPFGIAFDGTHLWVVNIDGNSVTEVNASDGSWVQTLSGGSYGFSNPQWHRFRWHPPLGEQCSQ